MHQLSAQRATVEGHTDFQVREINRSRDSDRALAKGASGKATVRFPQRFAIQCVY